MPVYIVKAGDTLKAIALRVCGDAALARQIAGDNGLSERRRLFVGQRLVVRCGAAQPAADGGDSAPAKTFRVISPLLNVRPTPVTSAAARPALDRGDTFTVRADEWVEGEGLRWWRHARGWSAEGSVDGRSVFVEDLTPEVPRAPSRFLSPRPPADERRVLLNVPYHSQEDQDARWAAADCGPACVRMLIGWHALRQGRPNPPLTVDEVSQRTGMGPARFSLPVQLVRVAGRYGLKLLESREATLRNVLAEISAGRPVISLVRYGSISNRQNLRFRGGHFVVVVGYDNQHIYVNDPDWWGDRRAQGAALPVPRGEFERAIGTDSWKAGNPPYWGLFVDPSEL